MRTVRCRECGSPDVPAAATCPQCGVKTPVELQRPRWLVAVVLIDVAAAAVIVWFVLSRQSKAPPREGDPGAAQAGREVDRLKRRNAVLVRRNEDLARENARLQADSVKRPPAGDDWRTGPAPAPANDALRRAHVRWAVAYFRIARLWREPYVTFEHARTLGGAVADLARETRHLGAVLAESPDAFPPDTADILKRFERTCDRLRQCLDGPGRQRADVSARSDWRESDVEVRAGDLIYLDARGTWSMTRGGVPGAAEPETEPAAPLVASQSLGSLLWRVRGTETTHALMPAGQSPAVRIADAGAIEFRINEEHLEDNDGSLTVEVMILPRDLAAALEAAGARLLAE